jgi:sugar phosphate isomerase/epimerase
VIDPSVQLYTVRAALQADFQGTLARLADFGYTQVEPFAFVDFLDELRRLPEYGLTAPTTHVALLKGDQDRIFAAATELGVQTVIDPMSDRNRWEDPEYVTSIADGLNAAAERARAHGLRVGYHNHHFELASKIDGRHALEFLAERLSPEVVLEVDTYWAYAGGADVPALLQRLGDRVVALHIKDGDGTLDTKKQVPVGSGQLPVWDFIAAAPHALPVVELDDSEQDLVEATGTSREYLLAGPARS